MSTEDSEHRKDVKGILMKNGRLFCLRCFGKNLPSVLWRQRHLETRIGPTVELPRLRDMGLVITQTDVEADDTGYICDKCGQKIK